MQTESDQRGRCSFGVGLLASVGGKLFRLRLLVGLAVTAVGLEVLSPTPFYAEPYRIVHIFALVLIAAGLVLRAWGAGSAGTHTRSATIEAERLATGGAFAYVRNPIYLASICIGIGMATLIGDPAAFLLASVAFGILYFSIVPAEEAFLLRQFGQQYRRYQEAVPRLFPRLTPFPGREQRPFHWRAIRGELLIALLLIVIYCAVQFEEHLDKIGWS
jgi:protein-S-isoprenylcysteine O-methyltransferase Ste14